MGEIIRLLLSLQYRAADDARGISEAGREMIEPLHKVQEDATIRAIREALKHYLNVSRAASKLEVHKNTVRHYMKKAGITPSILRQWKDDRLRQRDISFNKESNLL